MRQSPVAKNERETACAVTRQSENDRTRGGSADRNIAPWLKSDCLPRTQQPSQPCKICSRRKRPSRYCLVIINWSRTRTMGNSTHYLERLSQPSTKWRRHDDVAHFFHVVKHGGAYWNRPRVNLTFREYSRRQDWAARIMRSPGYIENTRIISSNWRTRKMLKKARIMDSVDSW